MIPITSPQEAVLVSIIGIIFLLLCGGGMILALRRGWFRTKYRDVEISRAANPVQFWIGIAAYIFGAGMGLYFISLAIF